MPRQGSYTQQQVDALLKDYIRPEECASTEMPRDLPPDLVLRNLRNELKPDFGHAEMARAMRVARFYVLRDLADQIFGMIEPAPGSTNEFRRACHLIVAASELGDTQQRERAAEAYQRILAGQSAEDGKNLEFLVHVFFHLPGTVNKKSITDRVSQLRAEQERKGNQDDLWEFEECERRLLPWVLQEKARRDWFVKMPPGPERTQQWAEAYLMFDMKTPFKWDEAAGYGLLRIARDEGDAAATEGLRAAMKRIDPLQDEPDAVKFRKTRGYRARTYFLEAMDAAAKRDMNAAAASQDDLIR